MATRFTEYRHVDTGELAAPSRLGTTEDGRPLYQAIEGWEPVGCDYECDSDGNWIPVD